MRITSAANPSIKLAKNLAQHPRAARKEGLSLAEGIHLARELLSHPELVRKVFLREGAEKNFEISEILQKYLSLKISVVQLPSQIYASISPVDTSAGIVCEIRIQEEGKIKKDEDWIYLDGVQDPGNVGTILRSALASGVTNIALSQQCAYVWSPKVLRSAMGAHFFCNIISSVELEEIKEKTGAAFSSLLILPIEGFHAPLFSEPFHWWPFAVLMFVLIFPTVISYLLIPIGLKYLKTTLVAIYGYLILIVATITSLLIGQDRFSWTQTFAIICICAGVYLVEIAEGKEKKTVKV